MCVKRIGARRGLLEGGGAYRRFSPPPPLQPPTSRRDTGRWLLGGLGTRCVLLVCIAGLNCAQERGMAGGRKAPSS